MAPADHPEHQARIARLDAMIEQASRLPSWPTMAVQLERLTQDLATLQARVTALEQECDALRQRELTRLWECENPDAS